MSRALAWATERVDDRLVGFVCLAWDGGTDPFLLDRAARPDWRRRGIRTRLVNLVVDAARGTGLDCVHVDFCRDLRPVYERRNVRTTAPGLIRLRQPSWIGVVGAGALARVSLQPTLDGRETPTRGAERRSVAGSLGLGRSTAGYPPAMIVIAP